MRTKKDGVCRWFLRCTNPATATQAHPILGDVPICAACQAWYGRMAAKEAGKP